MAVYSWGANSHGQLGLGFESELCLSPQLVARCPFAAGGVRNICGGGGHVLVLDSYGRIHSCGWNHRGQLGLNSTADLHNEFQSIPSEFFEDVAVERIACGWDVSGCITVTKKLYVWGSNSFQQLGLCQRGFCAVRRPLPVVLPRDEAARRVTFGLRYCAVLTDDNKIYIFGRLKVNDPPPTEVTMTATTLNRAPVLKLLPCKGSDLCFTSMASGQNHLLIKVSGGVGSARRVLALGDNKYGQSNAFHFEEDVKQLAAGWTHNGVVLKDKRVLLWGRNSYGQLGMGTATDRNATPAELSISDNMVPVQLHLGAEHALLRCADGCVYTWGWNEHGNCGNNTTENVYRPSRVDLPGAAKVAGVGAGFCYVVCDA